MLTLKLVEHCLFIRLFSLNHTSRGSPSNSVFHIYHDVQVIISLTWQHTSTFWFLSEYKLQSKFWLHWGKMLYLTTFKLLWNSLLYTMITYNWTVDFTASSLVTLWLKYIYLYRTWKKLSLFFSVSFLKHTNH